MKWEDLEAYRAMLGVRRDAMAKLLGVSEGTYSGWKRRSGVPRYVRQHIATLRKLNDDMLDKLVRDTEASCDE
jgi:DNA-binding transcriptional regulator YiaG